MNFRQLILRNLLGNRQTYAAYFISSVFAVFVFYIFTMLIFHPQMQENLSYSENISGLAQVGLWTALVVIALLSLLFLWYTFVVFLKRRKRDFAIYQVVGIEEKDLRKMLFFENALLGTFATVGGILLGILFSKLILLIAQNVMHLNQGLAFHVPIPAVILTFCIYVLLFLVISFVSTRRVQVKNIISLLKEDEKPRPEPKANWFLTLLGAAALISGYSTVLYFGIEASKFHLVLLGTLLTILGTLLLFYQLSVFVLKALKKRPQALQKTNLLFLSEMIFRMRDNAMMYSLITITAAVAFVGISVMMSLGNRSFANVTGPSFAYTFYSGNDFNETGNYQSDIFNEVTSEIEAAGYQPDTYSIPISDINLPVGFEESEGDALFMGNGLSIIRYSDYADLMEQLGETTTPIADDEILVLSGSYSRSQEVGSVPKENRKHQYTVSYGGVDYDELEETMTIIYSTDVLSIDVFALSVVSDEKFAEISATYEKAGITPSYMGIIDYPEWNDNLDLNNAVITYLGQINTENREKANEFWESHTQEELEALSIEDNPYADKIINYSSRYQIFQENRQGNGVILMITVLIGAVFFTFAASILYFRLFADLEKDGAYHRSLHIMGVTPDERHQIVRQQMRVMYFLPALIAALHFAVAMVALRLLVELPVWEFYGKIVGLYLAFQLVFYWLCKNRYLQHLDHIADPD